MIDNRNFTINYKAKHNYILQKSIKTATILNISFREKERERQRKREREKLFTYKMLKLHTH